MRYARTQSGMAPLQLQLGPTPAGVVAKVRAVEASGENSTGTASDPVLSRPSVPGVGTNQFGTSLCNTRTSVVPVISSFSVAPSLPTVTGLASDLPSLVRFSFPFGSEILLLDGGALLLYASTSGGHTWTGGFQWEEI